MGFNSFLCSLQGDWSFEECEQQSPVSVLDTPFREVDQQPISPFHPTRIANIGSMLQFLPLN